jgi:hypothetical protein
VSVRRLVAHPDSGYKSGLGVHFNNTIASVRACRIEGVKIISTLDIDLFDGITVLQKK